MPTLIRLVITLLFLAGLVYAAMFMLVALVEPTPKEVTIRIPARELLGESAPATGNQPAPLVEPPSLVQPPPAATGPAAGIAPE
ncbi:hypothetical protein [uncultured Devosia sp.]|uniref:hypothetical protein n=1 Tax=uncultured Devosia sp. TaxID=211434 RepID=UPI0035C97D24